MIVVMHSQEIPHPAHCRSCKERVSEMFTAAYRECRVNHAFQWSAKAEDYAAEPIGKNLQAIRAALGDLRGYRDFIKSALVPPCDFYMPKQRLIAEFDESQHFTRQRLITLSFYPEDLKLGFPLQRWRELCRRIAAVDDVPVDRDERRAWYDALRDLVPAIHGFKPTIRLYAADYPWCSLDPANAEDRATFHGFLKGETKTAI
jgi:hypothetical protein